jgi:hypothetical protein
MRKWRKAIGTLLILTPLLVFIVFGLSGIGLDGNGHSLDLNASLLRCHDVRFSASLRLRRGGHPVAEGPKGLRGNLPKRRLHRCLELYTLPT